VPDDAETHKAPEVNLKQTYSIVATNYCGPRAEAIVKALTPGADLTLVREPDNKFDKNAVAVYAGAERIGYIPKAKNVVLAQFMDQHEEKNIQVMAQDETFSLIKRRTIAGKFAPSPNSSFPQVEVG
jgi:hypothetical protein